MRRLILMRHAKSDWGAPGLADHDRPLNQRGRLAAALMGAFLKDEGIEPDIALVSTALRTRETWSLMGIDAPATFLPTLYHAAPEAIAAAARSAPEEARTALILGHQPGMQAAANWMSDGRRIDAYPTAQVVVLTFDDAESWADIGPRGGAPTRIASPKSLV